MRLATASLGSSLHSIGRGLRAPGFYLLLLASVALWALAYQQKAVYTLDVGGKVDDAYVSGFHAKERNADLDYRWSGSNSSVRFPGVGNQPLILSITTIGHRPEGDPPLLTVRARGQKFTHQTTGEPRSESFPIERGDPFEGDVEVEFSTTTFTPAGDARRLGVIVDRVTITPADFELRPFVLPPVGAITSLLAGLVILYAIVLATVRSIRAALVSLGGLSLIAFLLILFARPELGLLTGYLPELCLWGLALALASRALLDSVLGYNSYGAVQAAGWGSAAFSLAFLLRYGGLIYPQFLTSDILLHAHNILSVLGGEWVFSEPLPDGTPAPYPNALYLLLAPFALLFGTSDESLSLLLKWSGALFDSATCLALAWALSRVWSARAGGIAALVYALSPAPMLLFSAGNYANIFGQAALNFTLLGGLVLLARRSDFAVSAGASFLAAGFFLTVLGHYGIMLATLLVVGMYALWAAWGAGRGRAYGAAWVVVGAFVVSLAASFLLYYRNFAAEMWHQWSGVLARLSGSGPRGGPPVDASSLPGGIWNRIATWLGVLAALMGLFGAFFLARLAPTARALLVCWLFACAIFALLDQALGDAVRWYYLAAAPASLLAGGFLALLTTRGRPARALTALVLLALLTHLLLFWVGELIFTRYH